LSELESAVNEDPMSSTAYLFKGMTEQKLKQFSPSIDSFQRAQELNPEYKQTALYYQGVAHYYNEDLDTARTSLDQSIQLDSKSPMADRSRKVLDRVNSGKPAEKDLSLTFGVGFLYDDNLTSSTQDLVSNVDDVAATFEISVSYKLLKQRTYSAGITYDFYQSLYADEDDFDLSSHTLGLSLSKDTKPLDFGFDYLIGYNMLGGESFFQNHSLIPSVGYAWSPQLYTRINYHLQFKNFQQAIFDERDGNNNSFGADQYYFLEGGKIRAQIGYRYMIENTDADRFDYKGYSMSASLKTPLSVLGDLLLRYNYLKKDFTKITPSISQERQDNIQTAQITLTRSLPAGFALKIDYQYIHSNSNFEVVDYEKNIVLLGVSYKY
jgi:tetratricopeptide (TPR) repeat protein